LRICTAVVLGLAPQWVVVVVCAGKLGCGMLARSVFAGHRMIDMRGVRTCRAMIGQGSALRSAARTGCRGVTAEATTTSMAASASTHVPATAAAAAATTRVAASAAR
jgi:hypothetical protein